MIPGLVSIFALTIDRFDLSSQTLNKNIANANGFAPLELLVCDNGSKDRRIVEFIAKHPLTSYHRVNSKNEGVGKSFNQLYLRSKGEFLCFLGTDLEMPNGWLKEMIGYVKGIPNSGIIGMNWGHGSLPPLTEKFGSHAHWLTKDLNRVFGVWVMRRKIVEEIGLFYENFDVYGLEDSEFNERVNRSGYNSCYVPAANFHCRHLGVGDADTGEYREMKNRSMTINAKIFMERYEYFNQGGSLVAELPPMRDPL